jgi:hypothetical protein
MLMKGRCTMLLSVKGTFQDGVARPAEPLQGYDGQPVIITFLSESATAPLSLADDSEWAAFEQLKACAVETGIGDLAHQHNHYLYGASKVK